MSWGMVFLHDLIASLIYRNSVPKTWALGEFLGKRLVRAINSGKIPGLVPAGAGDERFSNPEEDPAGTGTKDTQDGTHQGDGSPNFWNRWQGGGRNLSPIELAAKVSFVAADGGPTVEPSKNDLGTCDDYGRCSDC